MSQAISGPRSGALVGVLQNGCDTGFWLVKDTLWFTINSNMGLFSLAPRLVIVEDNIALAEIYKTRMEILGYKCFVAYDGQQALEIIEREKPRLVLLDLMVPKIAGDQILETMRANEWGKDIKVLIISNLNEADAPMGLRDKGIEGYVVKANLKNDDLDQLVNTILQA